MRIVPAEPRILNLAHLPRLWRGPRGICGSGLMPSDLMPSGRFPVPGFSPAMGLRALAALYFALITLNAWVAEDAYLTFRVVENAVNGYGLRWNPDQRVQAYTNPLWMLLLVPFHAVTGEVFYTSIGVSLAVNLVLVRAILGRYARRPLCAGLLLVALMTSRSFVDFTVCGLENPLTFALTAYFFLALTQDLPDGVRMRRLCFTGALMAVNRMDLAILAAPAALHAIAAMRRPRPLAGLAWGWPAAAWYGFALLYYGTPFPNTYYAKLTAGVEAARYQYFGQAYVADIFINDLPTGMVLAAGLALTLWYFLSWARRGFALSAPAAQGFFLGLGPGLYCCYVYKVGGDFMSGRFWTPPFFAFALLLLHALSRMPPPSRRRALALSLGLLAAAAGGRWMLEDKAMKAPLPTFAVGEVPESGIVNERSQYYGTNALLGDARPQQHVWPGEKRREREQALMRPRSGRYVSVTNAAGMVGYYLGPEVTVIDTFALADPLLARLPAYHAWRAGHNSRAIPEGYVYFRETGDDQYLPPGLRACNRAIALIVSGDLFSPERLRALWALHGGACDAALQAYRPREDG